MSQAKVREFHEKFDLPRREVPAFFDEVDWDRMLQRWNWHMHEMAEMYQAIVTRDVGALADGVLDAEYFGRGTLVELGINGDPLMDAIHQANMAKERRRGVDKIAKPKGWQAPDIDSLIEAQRK